MDVQQNITENYVFAINRRNTIIFQAYIIIILKASKIPSIPGIVKALKCFFRLLSSSPLRKQE